MAVKYYGCMTATETPAMDGLEAPEVTVRRRRSGRKRRGKPEAQNPNGKRLFLYIRISDTSGREDTQVSSEIQLSQGQRYVAQVGATIVEVIYDLNKSGREFDKRQIGDLIDRVEQGEAEGILVYKIDRWGRNLADSLRNILDLQGVGGLIFSASENLDEIDSPMGRFQLSQLLLMAQYQSDQIGERWRDLHDYRLSKGLPSGGGKRFGYVYTPSRGRDALGHYEPDEDGGTADAVREVYRRYIANQPVPQIVDWLRDRGFKTTRGTQFSQSSVYNFLDAGFAAGLLVSNDGDKAWGVIDRTYMPGRHDPLIDPETWQRFKDKRTRIQPARTKSAPYRLAGLVWCAGCKKRCYKNDTIRKPVHSAAYSVPYLRCHLAPKARAYMTCPAPARITMAVVEGAVLAWLQARDGHQELAKVELMKRQRVGALQADREKAERGLARAQARLIKLVNRTLLDEHDPSFVDPMTYKLSRESTLAEIGRLESQVMELGREERVNTSPADTEFRAVLAGWNVLDAPIMNAALERLIQCIYITQGPGVEQVHIVGRFEDDPFIREDGRKSWSKAQATG